MKTRSAGDWKRLAAGLGLIFVGLAWILRSLDVLATWRLVTLAVAAGLFGLGALCYLAFRTDPASRWGFLVPAGTFGSLSLVALLEVTFHRAPEGLTALVFFLGPAAAFAQIHLLDRRRGWALVSAWLAGLLGVAAFLGSLRVLHGDLGGAIFLAGSGAILLWHFLRTGKDWAILPAGFLFASAATVLVEGLPLVGRLAPVVFLLGLTLTFATLYAIGRPGSTSWARPAAVVFAVLAALTLVAVLSRPLLAFGVPLALIALGVYLVLRERRGESVYDGG